MEYTNKIKNAVDAMESANNRNELLKQYSLARESLDNLLTELRNKLRPDAPISIAACKPIDLDDLEMRFKYSFAGEDFLNEYFPGLNLQTLFCDFASLKLGQHSKYSYAVKNPMCEDFYVIKLFRESDPCTERSGSLSIEFCNKDGLYIGPSIDCGQIEYYEEAE